jgi:hypothetical protein
MMAAKSKTTLAGIALCVGGVAMGAYLMHHIDQNSQPKQTITSIVFPDKVYADTQGYVTIMGRWDGEGVYYKNNATLIGCNQQQSVCSYYTIEQIGVNQVGSLNNPTEMPITHWDDSVITATDAGQDGGVLCVKNTINIDRKSETAELVIEPINQSTLNCAKADNKIYKWWIGGSIFWDRMRAATAAAKDEK